MRKNISLLSLQIFNTTGGIQKMVRTLAHALNTLSEKNGWEFKLSSLYEAKGDLMTQYVPPNKFEGFDENLARFIYKTVFAKNKPDVAILTHINLAVVGLMIKLFNPRCEIWLVAHGIEVWRPLSFHKRLILKHSDKIICVSNYTKQQMYARHKTPADKCYVLNNTIDPFIKIPASYSKPDYLLKRYSLNKQQPVVYTLTRLASTEQYKGHDSVLEAMKDLKQQFPDIKYILSGQYDKKEGLRVKELIANMGLTNQVILTGYVEDEELPDHFLLADIFVLPSKKEGFGIVFIEASACGLPVICGNADGSIDAILNGELGTAIDTDNIDELKNCITNHLKVPLTDEKRRYLQNKCLQNFNEDNYMANLQKLLTTNG